MDLQTIMLLKKNIIKIVEKKRGVCWEGDKLQEFTINKISHKYSNTKVPLYRFFYKSLKDFEIITRNNHYDVTYKCIKCDSIHCVALNNILRKINRGIINCRICKEYEQAKTDKQSIFMREKYSSKLSELGDKICDRMGSWLVEISLLQRLENDKIAFEKYDSEFKENYFKRNMDFSEFEYIKNKIISIQNKKICIDSFDFIYFPCVSISNQTRFSPYLYCKSRNNVEKIVNIEFKCDSCNQYFISKDLHSHKNRIKVLCKDCNLCNNVFKIRNYRNLANETILYQSKFELKFIRYCNEHKINLINGPKVEYFSNIHNKICTYKIDFAIPKLKLLVEIKDNHIWHKNQVNSGKWDEKVGGVCGIDGFINKGGLFDNINYKTFIVIFPKNYLFECEKIVKDYWADGMDGGSVCVLEA